MSTTVVIREISKTYPAAFGAQASTAVNRVSLTINAGELFFLLGPSGCGKTTLLRMIAGFIEPTSGDILFKDDQGEHTVTYWPAEKRDTGMVFQSYALWPHMTVAQNVAFGLEVRRVAAAERERMVMEALQAVRMEAYASRKPTQLSGGQQQRVALARALVIRPRVLLLDEPLSNLDAKLRLELRGEIRRVCKASGITTVYVTHDQKEAMSMADRVAVLEAGQVVQVGSPKQLYRAPATRFVAEFLGETNILRGEIQSITDSGVTVNVGGSTLLARSAMPAGAKAGSPVQVSIRHEALTLGKPGNVNVLQGTLVDSVYLGEAAQHRLDMGESRLVTVMVQNPGSPAAAGFDRIGSSLALHVAPEDVVLLPGAAN
ncbi:MAG: ATP-binding cassette domain-containing protein [Tepidisphaera sp.]|nr:ATP-binding cassette domain-containing protein [Tepidisphaera sp.]